jgi:hypothetical protein
MGSTADPSSSTIPPPSTPDALIPLTLSQLTTLLNNAVTQAAAAAKASTTGLPAGVKIPNPEILTGRKSKDVRPWVSRTKDLITVMGINLEDSTSVRYAATFLSSTARSWYQSECDRSTSYGLKDTAGFSTFEEFAKALITHLGDPNPATKARNELLKLSQVTSVKQYADEFQRITTLLPDMDSKDVTYFFHRGLKPQIRNLLIHKFDAETDDWQTVRDRAYLCDDAVMTHRSSATSSTYRATSHHYHQRDSRPDDPMVLGAISTERHHQNYRLGSNRSATPGPSHRRSTTPAPPPRTSTAGLTKLTDADREYLIKNNGCFRCRQINADHSASNCRNMQQRSVPSTSRTRASSPTPSKN